MTIKYNVIEKHENKKKIIKNREWDGIAPIITRRYNAVFALRSR